MNKITKIGLSALCGSLASVSAANAGALDVAGSATATWTSLGNTVTGNPIGMASGITFTGNGELDGGQTFTLTLTDANKSAWSTGSISLTTNNIGTFVLNSGGGGAGIGGYDDNMPRAWEEVWDTAIATNANFQKGVSGSTNISWTSPTALGTKLQLAYAPDNDGATSTNKGVSGDASNHFGAGFDAVLDIDMQGDAGGVNLFLGASETEIAKVKPNKDLTGDHEEAVVGLTITVGPMEVGAQISGERLRPQTYNAANYYANSSWGFAFNVNDDLSVSYSEARHVYVKTKKQGSGSLAAEAGSLGGDTYNPNEYIPKSWMRGESIQVAYTVGGVGLKYAQTKYDNTAYGFDAKAPKESRVFAVSLAF